MKSDITVSFCSGKMNCASGVNISVIVHGNLRKAAFKSSGGRGREELPSRFPAPVTGSSPAQASLGGTVLPQRSLLPVVSLRPAYRSPQAERPEVSHDRPQSSGSSLLIASGQHTGLFLPRAGAQAGVGRPAGVRSRECR